jgi:KipI family sensor histidine kinase inhibitor
MDGIRITDVGDTAFNVEFGEGIDPAVNARVMALRRAVEKAGPPGLLEAVPTFRSLLVRYDPLVTGRRAMEETVRALAATGAEAPAVARRRWTIPVLYDGEDLETLGRARGLDRDGIIALHAGAEFMVYMLGFMPGFAYLGGLPEALRLPRRASPRLKVPAGSVAVADALCAVYPWDSPGGWHLIGRTHARFFDLARDPPSLLAPGDRVRFRPVGPDEYETAAPALAEDGA